MTDRSEITLSLDAVRGEVSKFDRIGAGLAELEAAHPKDIVCAVDTPDGWEQAIVARRAWREPRIALEKAREAAKRPVLELGRQIDSFAKDLKAKLSAGEDHYDAQIKAEEARREAEKQRRVQIEAEKIAAIRRRIAEVFSYLPAPGVRPTVAELAAMRDRLELEPVDESYGDLKIEAQETKVLMLHAFDDKIAEQRAFEEQQAEVARQRAAFLEEQRQETARRAAERAEQDAREAAAAADRQRQRQAEEDALAQERAEMARQRAELDRREAEARERDRVVQEAAEAAEAEHRAEVAAAEQKMRAAHQAEIRLTQAAPAMWNCLELWRSAELHEDALAITNARAVRDSILSSLTSKVFA